MSMTTFSAQVDEDSGLVEQFEEYRMQKGMTKSEAVRSLMRQSLERELDASEDEPVEPDRDRDQRADAVMSESTVSIIEGNEAIIIGFAFLIGADGILSSLTAVAGPAGASIFVALGLVVVAAVLRDVWVHWRASDDAQTPDRTHSGAGGAD